MDFDRPLQEEVQTVEMPSGVGSGIAGDMGTTGGHDDGSEDTSKNFILDSIRDLRGEDVANSLLEHAKDVSWVESKGKNIPQYGGGPARGIYQYEIKGTKDGSGASKTALNRFYKYISNNSLSIPLEYEEELKNLSNRNNPDFTELSPDLQSQIFYADKALGAIPLDKLADGSLSSRNAWVKYHWAGSEKERPNKEKQFDRAMRTRPTDKMLSENQSEEESGFLDTVGEYASDAYNTATEYVGDVVDTVGEYASDAYDTASEYVGETVDTLEGVAETVGDKLRRLLNLDEDTETDTPPLPMRRPEQASMDETERAFSDVISDVKSIPEKAEGGSVEKEVEFVKEDDDDVPDPPPGATPEEVADDIPAYLSTGEYVLPANVVRYIGLKNIADMHKMALAELQQMEDLDIIENVDENGYVEEDDDETEYMEPEGAVEVIIAEHHPKGLMSMGFAEGGPVEAMVYVPGVGFVPQTEAATQPVKTKEEDTPVSKLKESGEDTQADRAQQEEETEKISAEEAKSRAEKGYLGTGPISGLAAGVTSAISAEQALSSAGVSRDQYGNTTFGPAQTAPLGTSIASSIAGLMSNPGVPDAVKDHMSTSLSDEQMSEVLDSIESSFDTQAQQEAEVGLDAFGGVGAPVGGEAESESESESESGTGSEAAQGGGGADTAGLRRGGYVTKKGIMNRPY